MSEFSDDEIFIRAQEMFGNEYACWPSCGPREVIALTWDAYAAGKVCKLDFYATVATLLLLTSGGPQDVDVWPPRTPAEVGAHLGLAKKEWPQIVAEVRRAENAMTN